MYFENVINVDIISLENMNRIFRIKIVNKSITKSTWEFSI